VTVAALEEGIQSGMSILQEYARDFKIRAFEAEEIGTDDLDIEKLDSLSD